MMLFALDCMETVLEDDINLLYMLAVNAVNIEEFVEVSHHLSLKVGCAVEISRYNTLQVM